MEGGIGTSSEREEIAPTRVLVPMYIENCLKSFASDLPVSSSMLVVGCSLPMLMLIFPPSPSTTSQHESFVRSSIFIACANREWR